MADADTGQGTDEPGYWRSLRELYDGGAVHEQKAHEFMAGVTDGFDLGQLSTMSRKRFLALLSASAAFAATGCTNYRDKGEIVPYTKKPEEIVPGVANLYASTCTGCSQQCGILVKTREGRPIKIDGNPEHPINRGKICAAGQASILNLYDPARLRRPMFGARSGKIGDTTWEDADAAVSGQLARCVEASREIALITHAVTSPSARALLADFQRTYPTTRVYAYELFNEGPRERAWERCYGDGVRPAILWDRADVILALESDFLGTEGWTIEQVRQFTSRRDVVGDAGFNRLYCVEGGMSLTGSNADYRLRLRPDAQLEFILSLIHELSVVRGSFDTDAELASALRGRSLKEFASNRGLDARVLMYLADDLISSRGRAFVHAGPALPDDVHVAVNYLNNLLGAGALYDWAGDRTPPSISTRDEWNTLVARMKDGTVGLVVHVDANPVYHFPAKLGYADALKSVPMVVSLVESEDETSQLCTYVLPINDQLESWGDYRPQPGVDSFQQPVIAPLYDTRQKEAVLLQWMAPESPYAESIYADYLKRRWEGAHTQSGSPVAFSRFWASALHDGVVVRPAPPVGPRPFLKEVRCRHRHTPAGEGLHREPPPEPFHRGRQVREQRMAPRASGSHHQDRLGQLRVAFARVRGGARRRVGRPCRDRDAEREVRGPGVRAGRAGRRPPLDRAGLRADERRSDRQRRRRRPGQPAVGRDRRGAPASHRRGGQPRGRADRAGVDAGASRAR